MHSRFKGKNLQQTGNNKENPYTQQRRFTKVHVRTSVLIWGDEAFWPRLGCTFPPYYLSKSPHLTVRKDVKARRKKSDIFAGNMAICKEYNCKQYNQQTTLELTRNCSKMRRGLLSQGNCSGKSLRLITHCHLS